MKLFSILFLALMSLLVSAEEPSAQKKEMSLKQQVQNLKKEVRKINRDLFILEEDLLYPASTQIALFLSLDAGEFFKLDGVKVSFDDDPLTAYLYTDLQRDALRRGGVQRLHMGNIKAGTHQLTAVFIGYDPDNKEIKRAVTYDFEKSTTAVKLELSIVDKTKDYQPEFSVIEWP